jgi:hypothetical protein
MASRKAKEVEPPLWQRARAWLDARELVHKTSLVEKHYQLVTRMARLEANVALRRPERVAKAIADILILLTASSEQLGLPLDACLDARLKELRYRDGTIKSGRWEKIL